MRFVHRTSHIGIRISVNVKCLSVLEETRAWKIINNNYNQLFDVNFSIHVSTICGCLLFGLLSKVYDILLIQKTPAACKKSVTKIAEDKRWIKCGYANACGPSDKCETKTHLTVLLGKWKICLHEKPTDVVNMDSCQFKMISTDTCILRIELCVQFRSEWFFMFECPKRQPNINPIKNQIKYVHHNGRFLASIAQNWINNNQQIIE